ncbi:hypothetical protein [Lachnoclostridium phytofermentans]|uniref:hypothetical protein n=1 Tax=Lachnoclostridium phytofermentans TaxID=66219 RepID=UPI000497EE6A|nr:hypothetical protein [Lachnoclostridium phytofermentans]
MDINFSTQDALFIYGTFKKKVQQLEEIKNTPGCPFSDTDMKKEIKLYTSIMDKLKDAVPGLEKLDSFSF